MKIANDSVYLLQYKENFPSTVSAYTNLYLLNTVFANTVNTVSYFS